MKLTKKGKKMPDSVIKGVCIHCQAEYEDVESKLTLKEYLMHDGVDYDNEFCSECNNGFTVEFVKR